MKETKKVLLKTSYLCDVYSSLSLPRNNDPKLKLKLLISQKNGIPMVPKEKFEDLTSLCSGTTPFVGWEEHVQFYKGLPHAPYPRYLIQKILGCY